MNKTTIIILVVAIIAIITFFIVRARNQFPLPKGETNELVENAENIQDIEKAKMENGNTDEKEIVKTTSIKPSKSDRKVSVTDGIKHSIPLDEILSGGPPKDGIPSIDNPKFLSVKEGDDFLEESDPGIGVFINGEARFYPYRILVWHEIVNDKIGDQPLLVTYCPLCATGIIFDRKVNGQEQEFGVSGKLWQSNLLMYNRAGSETNESLWSQVLGEAVLGVNTGERLKILPSDIIRYSDWKKVYPNTKVLSTDTDATRSYGQDPYGDYYTSESVSFGATFNDNRLHPKALVFGIEINGKYKAYHEDALKIGENKDSFAGREIIINKDNTGRIEISSVGESIQYIPGFWFSWLAVHPETLLFK